MLVFRRRRERERDQFSSLSQFSEAPECINPHIKNALSERREGGGEQWDGEEEGRMDGWPRILKHAKKKKKETIYSTRSTSGGKKK